MRRVVRDWKASCLPNAMGSLALFLILTGGSCHHASDKSHDLRNIQLTPAIEMRADEEKLEDLRTTVTKRDDIEVRIWIEPMMEVEVAEGYILKQKDSLWAGRHLLATQTYPNVAREGHDIILTPPSSRTGKSVEIEPLNGWDSLWKSLTNTGLLTLPDEGQLDLRSDKKLEGGRGLLIGDIYVVEIRTSEEYRTYRYTIPQRFGQPETKAMIRIIQILHDEFDKDQQD
jgi:hypothetical protein